MRHLPKLYLQAKTRRFESRLFLVVFPDAWKAWGQKEETHIHGGDIALLASMSTRLALLCICLHCCAQGKTRNGMMDAQEAPSSAASWSADNNEWGWNGQKSWNDWHSTENNDRKDWGVASTARSQTTKMEDDDDETWGTWKPLPAQPVPEPSEPPSKRPAKTNLKYGPVWTLNLLHIQKGVQ